jgi:8-oxo-dGTP pyrophosphatase MutT (NUDIX family)
MDFMPGHNITNRPLRSGRVSFDALKQLTDAWDIARICIGHRIDDVRSLKWSVRPAEGVHDNVETAIAYARQKIKYPEGGASRKTYNTWVAAFLEDVLRYDAGTLFRRRDKAGRVIGLQVVPGATIAPLLDVWGGTPEPPAPAYTQWIRGQATKQMTVEDIVYAPFRPQSDSPYGFAPLESVILTANTDLRMQAFLLQRFTAGTVPEGFAEAPPDLSTPEQIQDFQDHWDATMYGDAEAKHQIKWVPNGTNFTWSKDQTFDKEMSMWMAKKCAAAFHVTVNDLGMTDDVNRATGDTQVEVQFRVGTLPLIQHVEAILNSYLQDDLGLPVEFTIDDGQEKDDRVETANAWKVYIEAGMASPDEGRELVLGLPSDPEHPTPRTIMAPRVGPIPLSSIINAAGPTHPEFYGPSVTDLSLSTAVAGRPFTPAIGVAPIPGTDDDKAAASAMNAQQNATRQAYGKGQIGETPATAAQLATGVEGSGEGEETKKDVTGGITSGTGFTGNPLLAGLPVGAKSAEDLLADARRALAAGGSDAPVTKAETPEGPQAISVAGLAVKAADTGRVLLLQRALTEGDPAGGTWELPGGHLDEGETPAEGAIREWQEETGAPVPPGVLAGTWDDGIYRGHVMVVPSEATVTINLDHEDRDVLNPDDPHGDMVETIAWWDPEDLPGLTALRPELAAAVDVWLPVMRAARLTDGQAVRKDMARWRGIARKRVAQGAGDPCAFRSDVIPGAVAAMVRSRLSTARTADDVNSAFGVVVKGRPGKARGAWRDQTVDVPHRQYDLLITDHWVPVVLAAFEALWSDDQVMAACRAGDVGALGTPNTGPLEAALTGIWADAWVTGRAGALEQLDTIQKASLRDLKKWVPGLAKTVARATRDGMRAGLEIAQIIAGIVKTFLRSIALRLPSGREGAIDEAMRGAFSAIRVEVTASFAHAEMVTHSEIARVQTNATLETYREFGVTLWKWLVTDGACPRCQAKAAGGPYPLNAESPPAHPRCRCSASPVASSITY